MTDARPASVRTRPERSRDRRVVDYVAIARRHWFGAALAFLVVLGVFVALALFARPVYEATATLKVSQKGAEQQVLSQLSSVETPYSVETEMEVIRSFNVAKRAVGENEQRLTSVCYEKNAYRPLEVLMRGFGRGRSPARIEVRAAPLERGTRTLELVFAEDGRAFTVTDLDRGTSVEARLPDRAGGAVDVHGASLVVTVPAGADLAGRTFVLELRSLEDAAVWVQAAGGVDLVGEHTGIVGVSATSHAPHVARDVANALASGYLERLHERRRDEMAGVVAFLEQQIRTLKSELQGAESKRDAYMQEKGVYHLRARASTMDQTKAQLESKRDALDAQRLETRLELTDWGREGDLDDRLHLLSTARVDAVTNNVAARYAQIRRELSIALETMSSETPKIQAHQTELKVVKADLEARVARVTAATVERLGRKLASLDTQHEGVEADLDKLKADAKDYPEIERTLSEMAREATSRRRVLGQLEERLIEAKISQQSQKIQAEGLDAAQVPGERLSPRLPYMVVLGLLFGALAGAILAFVLDAADSRVRSPQALEDELGLQTYATVPSFTTVKKRERKDLKGGLVAIESPKSILTEAYRSLRANIRYAAREHDVRTLTITSSLAGEGKTVTTMNLAVVMAQSGASVVVVDADMRRSRAHEYIGCERGPGLAEVLDGGVEWASVVQHTKVPNLDLIAAGARHASPGVLLDSDGFRALLEDLKQAYDYVLLDAPPVLAVSDAASFFSQVDGVLMLCRDGRCPLDVVRGAVDQVERLGGKVLGIIFNAFNARRASRYGYGRGYYGHYGYHAYYADDESRRKPSG